MKKLLATSALLLIASTCFGQGTERSTTQQWVWAESPVFTSLWTARLSTVLPAPQNPVSSAQIGNATFNVPTTNPAVTIQTPARSGTMALLSDIVAGPGPAQSPRAKGIITLINGAGSATLSGFTVIPICVVADPSGNSVRFANTATVLTVSGVGPVVNFHCE